MTEDLQTRLIGDLVIESGESLDEFDQELLLLEKGEESPESLHRMFRTIHSLKGTSGCLGLGRIESVAHVGENLLSLLRDGDIKPTPQIISTLLTYSDALRSMLNRLAADGVEGDANHSTLLNDLQALANATSPQLTREPFGLFADEPETDVTPVPPSEHFPSHPFAEMRPAASAIPAPPGPAESAIRVDVEQLDGMMDLVGELVLARNQIMQFTGRLADPALIGATQRLNIITTKLQETVMKTRMQPVGNVWNKFPRIVRDISRDLGKQVRLVMDGKDTDLDRNIIEAIKDPLTHLVRNAIDHGLESPDQRLAAGKNPEGLLRLRAFHEGGQVNIEIHDDGGGIDRDKVIKRAIQRGLIHANDAAQLTEREIFSLIFAPGFSTADQVSNLSGRGVGMDVVKKNVERIGGSVDVLSELGLSTTIRIKIPLTLAIIPALIIRCANRRYAIPQVSLVELVRIESDGASPVIENVNGCPVYRLRGNLLPLLYLREQLGLPRNPSEGDSIFLLILQAETRQFGLVVDSVSDTEEIVVKPLGPELKGLVAYAGATIMGDGCVALILDVLGLARRAHVIEDSNSAPLLAGGPEANKFDTQRERLLLFSLNAETQAAVSLANVTRLEEFDRTRIERLGNSEVIQYRGEVMPLVRVNRVLGLPDETVSQDDLMRVVVYSHEGMSVGLVVHRILDTVEDVVSLQRSLNRPAILGSAIVKKRATDLLDIPSLLKGAESVVFQAAE